MHSLPFNYYLNESPSGLYNIKLHMESQSINLSNYLSIFHLSIHPSTRPYIFLSLYHPSIHPLIHLSIIDPSVDSFLCRSIHRSSFFHPSSFQCLSIHSSICTSPTNAFTYSLIGLLSIHSYIDHSVIHSFIDLFTHPLSFKPSIYISIIQPTINSFLNVSINLFIYFWSIHPFVWSYIHQSLYLRIN